MKFLGSLKSGEIYVHKDRDHYLIFTYNSKSWGVKDVFVHKMYMGGLGIAKYDYEASIEKLNTKLCTLARDFNRTELFDVVFSGEEVLVLSAML